MKFYFKTKTSDTTGGATYLVIDTNEKVYELTNNGRWHDYEVVQRKVINNLVKQCKWENYQEQENL